MKFIDEAKIFIQAGHGGRGCVSFRREKYVPRGGPDGGDGGKGGDIIFHASHNLATLLDFRYRPRHEAPSGASGEGNNRTGRSGEDIEIAVPVGTVFKNAATMEILADLTHDGERFIAAKGGIGGKGNAHFTSSTNRAPRFAQDGMPGEERCIILELKLLADVGIIGRPNVGKSTFISRVSAARPKIADYPFTTLIPNLGVVSYGQNQGFVIADIPGLITGAHTGAGMGVQFLKHVERTSVLLHILDISEEDYQGAWELYESINRELGLFNASLMNKPQIVAINKTDLPITRERMKKDIDIFREKGIEVSAFSAVTGEGLDGILRRLTEQLKRSSAHTQGEQRGEGKPYDEKGNSH
jgi:GTP-binding protein